MEPENTNQGNVYRIKVKGVLNHAMVDWLGDITIITQAHGETLLVGKFLDQPALRGLIDQLWNLNFTVLSVERIVIQDDQDSQQTEGNN